MARIAGINIPQNKLVHVGLTYIYGIGEKFSGEICKSLAIPRDKRVNQLTDCLLYTSPSPRDLSTSRMPSSA